jgi:hypothetical protein
MKNKINKLAKDFILRVEDKYSDTEKKVEVLEIVI